MLKARRTPSCLRPRPPGLGAQRRKEAGQPAAASTKDLTLAFKGRRYERGSTSDVPRDLRDEPASSSIPPPRTRPSRPAPVEPSEAIPYGGRSKDRRDYSPRLVTPLDQLHDEGIELLLPLCSLELLLRDAKRRNGQDVSSSSESMDDDDQGGGPLPGRRSTCSAHGSVTSVSR